MPLLVIAATVYMADQLTKMWIVQYFQVPHSGASIDVFGDFARLIYSTNTGAAFGLLQDRTLLFTVIAIAAIPLILLAQRELRRYGWPTLVTLGLLLGGTLGNLTDRLRLGYVVDFVDVGVGPLRWPTFNLADSAFVTGVGILCVYFLFLQRDAK